MSTYKIASAAAIALLVGAGSAAAYSDGFVRDTPSLTFPSGQSYVAQGGANLGIPRVAVSPVHSAPLRNEIQDDNPSREFQ